MSKPLLLEIAYQSILEVIQAKNLIKRESLLQKHPLLNEHLSVKLTIFVDGELCGSYEEKGTKTLLEAIVEGAKIAAFEDKHSKKLTLTHYFEMEIEISIQTPNGVISHRA